MTSTARPGRHTAAEAAEQARFSDPAAIRAHMVNDEERMPVRTVRARRGDGAHAGRQSGGSAASAAAGCSVSDSEASTGRTDRLGEVMVPGVDGSEVSLRRFCDSADTTGLLVLHRGRLVHSDWRHGFGPDDRHVTASISKSVFALVLAPLIHSGDIDPRRAIGDYVPELEGTGFGLADVDDAFHMLTAVRYGQRPFHKETEARAFFAAVGMVPAPADYAGPRTLLERLATSREDGPSGQSFRYENGNTEALGEVVRRTTGATVSALLEELVYSRIGANGDAHFGLDPTGRELVSGRFSCTLGDLTRLGQLMAAGGAVGEDQVLPADLIADFWTVPEGPASDVVGTGDERIDRPVLAYRRGWWLPLDGEGALVARGRSGQRLYINPSRQTVIAHFGAHPVAEAFDTPRFEPVFARLSRELEAREAALTPH
ncbi:serine hydrolase domain-containing protein [Brevibacterium renqingii]|uniref:serine hydrolase domain-containing protein n=1 Tax=Brevibacterium renqingii TaxID=2776916 RepID=UPI001AE0D492|nr:serine hydrolase [Brevibacterium renqingii]